MPPSFFRSCFRWVPPWATLRRLRGYKKLLPWDKKHMNRLNKGYLSKKWQVGGRGTPSKENQRRLRSDSGGQRGKLSPFEKFGNFDILKCPLLASEDEFLSYLIQFFIWKSSIFQPVNYTFGPFPLRFGISNLEIRILHPKIHRNRFHYLFLRALGRWASLLDDTFCINSTPGCVTACYFTQRG